MVIFESQLRDAAVATPEFVLSTACCRGWRLLYRIELMTLVTLYVHGYGRMFWY